MLVAVGLNWDQKQDEERSRADQQRRSDSLQRGWREVNFSSAPRRREASRMKQAKQEIEERSGGKAVICMMNQFGSEVTDQYQ